MAATAGEIFWLRWIPCCCNWCCWWRCCWPLVPITVRPGDFVANLQIMAGIRIHTHSTFEHSNFRTFGDSLVVLLFHTKRDKLHLKLQFAQSVFDCVKCLLTWPFVHSFLGTLQRCQFWDMFLCTSHLGISQTPCNNLPSSAPPRPLSLVCNYTEQHNWNKQNNILNSLLHIKGVLYKI